MPQYVTGITLRFIGWTTLILLISYIVLKII